MCMCVYLCMLYICYWYFSLALSLALRVALWWALFYHLLVRQRITKTLHTVWKAHVQLYVYSRYLVVLVYIQFASFLRFNEL